MGNMQSCKQMQLFSTQLLTPNTPVTGSNNQIITGIIYAIKSAKLNAYLHPGGISGLNDRCFVQPGIDKPYQYWIIQDQGNSQYAIRNVMHKSYLHPGGIGGVNDRCFVQPGIDRPYQLWQFQDKGNGLIAIRNVKHQNYYLHSGAKGGLSDRCFVQPGIDGLYQQWYFQPYQYKMSLKLRDFTYPDNIQDILKQNSQINYIDKNIMKVDQNSIGSSISRTFTKTVTNSFTWSLNQKFGISVSVNANVGIPLLGGGSITVTANAEIGSTQQWSKTEQITVSASATQCPKIPGTYCLSGWIDSTQDAEINWNAIAEVRVSGQRQDPNGNILQNSLMDDPAIQYYLRYNCPNFQPGNITNRTTEAIQMKISGVLRGSYEMRTETSFQRIGD